MKMEEREASAEKWCLELRYNGGTDELMRHWMLPYKPSQVRHDTVWRPQGAGDLGSKMAEAFRTAFQEGAQRVVLVSIPEIRYVLSSQGKHSKVSLFTAK